MLPPANTPRVGPNTLANPQPTRAGKNGGPGGRSPHGWGSWGVSPHKTKRGGELSTLATTPRVGPRTLANPKPTGVGKRGWRGLRPLPGGLGDLPPRTKNKGRVANSCNQAMSGTQNAGKPSANGGWKMGGQGGKAPWQGVWGVCPHKTKRGGESPTLATPPRVGPNTPANPQPTRVGK